MIKIPREDFKYYADICYREFGDRVKYWTTFNEPNVAVIRGYRSGIYPPSRCSFSFGNCSRGDSEREPFIAAHNIILSHLAAVHVYRTKYQKTQGGRIGIVMNCVWYEPFSNSSEDKLAAERAQSFYMNWLEMIMDASEDNRHRRRYGEIIVEKHGLDIPICVHLLMQELPNINEKQTTNNNKLKYTLIKFLDPIILGKYPAEMQELVGTELPKFSEHDSKKLNINGLDFIGINHYTSFFVKDCKFSPCDPGLAGASRTEGFAFRTERNNGGLIGEQSDVEWLYFYPQGMEKIVMYMKKRYNNTPMFITENGYGDKDKLDPKNGDLLNDVKRVDYMRSYLNSLATSLRNGADVRGYFAWSLLDNFEWTSGYTLRFGLYHVDYATLKRTPKLSAVWYKLFIANQSNYTHSFGAM